ncbi:hypothetical protein GGR58DRAFT_323575 [Xylaria digitata]|nr:hypothetical protein GGR58DRAFT_323575 [Xylaria digitata]
MYYLSCMCVLPPFLHQSQSFLQRVSQTPLDFYKRWQFIPLIHICTIDHMQSPRLADKMSLGSIETFVRFVISIIGSIYLPTWVSIYLSIYPRDRVCCIYLGYLLGNMVQRL